jgi:hypothetical protein
MGSFDAYNYLPFAQFQAEAESNIAFYNALGIPWGIAEWGLVKSGGNGAYDNPAFINMVAGICALPGCAFQVQFSTAGYGLDPVLTPLSNAAYITLFGP